MKKKQKKKNNLFGIKPVRLRKTKNLIFGFDLPKPTRKVKGKLGMSWPQAKKKFPKMSPFGDADKDGVKNWLDCRPFDKRRQGYARDQKIANKRLKNKYTIPKNKTDTKFILSTGELISGHWKKPKGYGKSYSDHHEIAMHAIQIKKNPKKGTGKLGGESSDVVYSLQMGAGAIRVHPSDSELNIEFKKKQKITDKQRLALYELETDSENDKTIYYDIQPKKVGQRGDYGNVSTVDEVLEERDIFEKESVDDEKTESTPEALIELQDNEEVEKEEKK